MSSALFPLPAAKKKLAPGLAGGASLGVLWFGAQPEGTPLAAGRLRGPSVRTLGPLLLDLKERLSRRASRPESHVGLE